jgi:hypothetical protein
MIEHFGLLVALFLLCMGSLTAFVGTISPLPETSPTTAFIFMLFYIFAAAALGKMLF